SPDTMIFTTTRAPFLKLADYPKGTRSKSMVGKVSPLQQFVEHGEALQIRDGRSPQHNLEARRELAGRIVSEVLIFRDCQLGKGQHGIPEARPRPGQFHQGPHNFSTSLPKRESFLKRLPLQDSAYLGRGGRRIGQREARPDAGPEVVFQVSQ